MNFQILKAVFLNKEKEGKKKKNHNWKGVKEYVKKKEGGARLFATFIKIEEFSSRISKQKRFVHFYPLWVESSEGNHLSMGKRTIDAFTLRCGKLPIYLKESCDQSNIH